MSTPRYDKEALLKAIEDVERNIKMFEDEIARLKETIVEYKRLAKETGYNGNSHI